MRKQDREIIFNKFGGRCSYCGCDLTGRKWHVDHAEAVERKFKRVGGGYFHKVTGEPATKEDFQDRFNADFFDNFEHKKSRFVPDGFRKPENHHMDNMMPACISCNVNKSNMNIEQFRNYIAGFMNSLNKYVKTYGVAKRYGLIEETGKPVIFYFETINTET